MHNKYNTQTLNKTFQCALISIDALKYVYLLIHGYQEEEEISLL